MNRDLIGYTDGSCSPNPGFGSWAWVVIQSDRHVDSCSGNEESTTNNRMEYMALIDLLEKYGPRLSLVRTDSKLLQQTCMTWRHSWKRTAWKGGQVKNLDLVKRLDVLLERHRVPIEWVKAHAGNKWNEYADGLASLAREMAV